jgi:5-methyltetrahydrofolate--homocysteine methyltransferase
VLRIASTASTNGSPIVFFWAVLHWQGKSLQHAQQALDAGRVPVDLIDGAIAPAMSEAGKLFEQGEYFVPELLMSARATKAVFEVLRPLLAQQGVAPVGRVVLGTVKGDLHDIGKNLVGAMLEGGGFEVVDLGVGVTPEQFVVAAHERHADIVGLSALLTTTLPAMQATVQAFESAGLRGSVKIMVGGAPVTQDYATSLGADGYAQNATAAVAVARELAENNHFTPRVHHEK